MSHCRFDFIGMVPCSYGEGTRHIRPRGLTDNDQLTEVDSVTVGN